MRTSNDSVRTAAGSTSFDLTQASVTSAPIRAENMTYISVQGVVAGSTALNGAFKLQACNDVESAMPTGDPKDAVGLTNWTDVTGATVTMTADGTFMINYADIGVRWIRVVYTRTAGSAGTATMRFNAKGW